MSEWNHRERRTLRSMYEGGVDVTLIAIELGRPIGSVLGKIKSMRLQRPKPTIDEVDLVPLSASEVVLWDRQIRADNVRKTHRLSLSEMRIWHEQERLERADAR